MLQCKCYNMLRFVDSVTKQLRGGEIMGDEKMTLEEWIETVSDEERRALIAKTKKRFWFFCWLALSPMLIILLWALRYSVTAVWIFLKTCGRSTGNNGVRALMMLYGFIIPPIIVVTLCSKIEKLGDKILGW